MAAATSRVSPLPKAYKLDYPWIEVSMKDLEEETGMVVKTLSSDLDEEAAELAALNKEGGYVEMDEFEASIDGLRSKGLLERMIGPGGQFSREHTHIEDEVRYIMEGACTWDVRDKNNDWIRVNIVDHEYVIMPQGAYHRFFINLDPGHCKAKRIYRTKEGWAAVYREDATGAVVKEAVDMGKNKTYAADETADGISAVSLNEVTND